MRRRYENGGNKKPGFFKRALNQLKANRISRKNRKLTAEEEDRIENPEKYFEQQKQELHQKYGDLIDERGYIKNQGSLFSGGIDTEGLNKDIRVYPNPIQSEYMKNVFNPMHHIPRNYIADRLEYYTDPKSLASRRYEGEFIDNPFIPINHYGWDADDHREEWYGEGDLINWDSRFIDDLPRKSWTDQKNLFTGALSNLTFLGQSPRVQAQQKSLAAFYEANPDILNYKDITKKYDTLDDFLDSEDADKYPNLANAIYSRRKIGDHETTGGYAWPFLVSPGQHREGLEARNRYERQYGEREDDYGWPYDWDEGVGEMLPWSEVEKLLLKYGEDPNDPKWKDLKGTITVSPYMDQIHPQWIDNFKSTLAHELGHHTFSHYLPEREKDMLYDLNLARHDGGHLVDTEETHADMDAIRQDMLDKGIYDYRYEQMTPDHWQQYLDTFGDGKLSLPLERFIKRYRIPEDQLERYERFFRKYNIDPNDMDINIRYLMNAITERNENQGDPDNLDEIQSQSSVRAMYGGRMTRTGDALKDTLKFKTRSSNYRIRAKYGHSRSRARHGGRFGLSSRGDVPRFEYGGSTPPTSTNQESTLIESLMALKPQDNGDEKKIKKFSKEWYNNYLDEHENEWFTDEELNMQLWKENYLQLQDGNPRVSDAGAFGLSQIMPETFNEWVHERNKLPPDADLNDPVVARYFQVIYMDWLMNRPYAVNAPTAEEAKHRALMAYNRGHGKTLTYFKNNPDAILGTEDNPGWGYDESIPFEGRAYARYIMNPVQFRKENPKQGSLYDGLDTFYCITCDPTKRHEKTGELLWTNTKDYIKGRNKHQPSEFNVDWGYQVKEGYEDRESFFKNIDMNFRYDLD
jgi:hypothetical protein